nr:unnamed protein product [Digitaria exilis]
MPPDATTPPRHLPGPAVPLLLPRLTSCSCRASPAPAVAGPRGSTVLPPPRREQERLLPPCVWRGAPAKRAEAGGEQAAPRQGVARRVHRPRLVCS